MKKILVILVCLSVAACVKTSQDDCINVDDSVIAAYLDGDISSVRESWAVQARTPFVAPPVDAATRSEVQHIREIVSSFASEYRHPNEKALDRLFPGWRDERIDLCLIVGCPLQYDVFSALSPDGKMYLILNLFSLAEYNVDDDTLINSLKELFSHELVHLIMEDRGYGESKDNSYLATLNRIAYTEGFACLLSYNSKAVGDIDWKSERAEYFESSRTMLADALAEEDPEQQSIFIRKADTGYYYEQYAAISSMLYLSKVYDRKGLRGLKKELNRGPKKICKRIVRKG